MILMLLGGHWHRCKLGSARALLLRRLLRMASSRSTKIPSELRRRLDPNRDPSSRTCNTLTDPRPQSILAMNHKALLVPDVLHEVFHHLRPLPEEWLADQVREKYQTLAALTRVCKVFQEPATRALWTTLPTDVAAFRALPEFISGAEQLGYDLNAGYGDEDEEEEKDSYWVNEPL